MRNRSFAFLFFLVFSISHLFSSLLDARPIFKFKEPRVKLKRAIRLKKTPRIKRARPRLLFPTKLRVSNVFKRPRGEMQGYVEKLGRTLDWNGEDLRCYFQWDSKARKRVKSFAVQVSLFPYSRTREDWRDPPGLVHEKKIAGRKRVFFVDFAKFAPRPDAVTQHFLAQNNLDSLKKVLGNSKKMRHRRHIRKRMRVFRRRAKLSLRKRRISLKGENALAQTRRDYHVRVVLLDSKGALLASPSRGFVIDYGEPEIGSEVEWHGSGKPERVNVPVNNPSMQVKAYEPIRLAKTEARYRFVVWKEPSGLFKNIYEVGQKVYLNPYEQDKKKGFWDRVGDAISAVVSFVEDAVNWASNAYASIKSGVAKFVASRIPGVDAAFVEGLIDAGLASIGVPPSLPNFDQLASMGKDYLAKTMVDQLPVAIPPDLAEEAIDKLVKEAEKAARSSGPSGYDFLRIDPEAQRREAHLILLLKNNSNEDTMAGGYMIEDQAKIFEKCYVSFPALKAGETLEIPVFLTPNNDEWNLSKPHALSDEEWYDRYKNWPARFYIIHSFPITPEYIAEAVGFNFAQNPFDLVMKNETTRQFAHDADSAYHR